MMLGQAHFYTHTYVRLILYHSHIFFIHMMQFCLVKQKLEEVREISGILDIYSRASGQINSSKSSLVFSKGTGRKIMEESETS